MSKAKDSAIVTEQVELTRLILSKGCDRNIQIKQHLGLPAILRMDQTPDLACAIIAVKIDAIPLGHGTSIDITTRDRATAFGVAVFSNRFDHTLWTATFIIMRPFAKIP